MKKILELKKTIIYGPVESRRLGRSLGINLLPGTSKLCSFDCIYCQYGWTKVHTSVTAGYEGIPTPGEVGETLEKVLASLEKRRFCRIHPWCTAGKSSSPWRSSITPS